MKEYKDRYIGLVVLGILELVLAGMCLLGLLFAGLGMAVSAGETGTPVRVMVPGLFFYLAAAAFFASMGVGSILARRWARTLMHVASILWLVVGIVAMAVYLLIVPQMLSSMISGQEAQMAKAMTIGVLVGSISVFPLYVGLPLVFLLFYRGRNVKATCEARDPKPRWTDHCPMPVLALSVMLAYGAASLVISAPLAIVPVFGRFVTGPPAAAILLALGGVLAWLAYGAYRLQRTAWWLCIALTCAGTVSGSLTFRKVGMVELLGLLDMGMEEMVLPPLATIEHLMTWQIPVSGAVFLAFVLVTGRYFRVPASPPSLPRG